MLLSTVDVHFKQEWFHLRNKPKKYEISWTFQLKKYFKIVTSIDCATFRPNPPELRLPPPPWKPPWPKGSLSTEPSATPKPRTRSRRRRNDRNRNRHSERVQPVMIGKGTSFNFYWTTSKMFVTNIIYATNVYLTHL